MTTIRTADLVPYIRTHDIMVMLDGKLGYISNAVRVGADWFLSVRDNDTRAIVGEIRSAADGGTIEVVEIRG